MNERPIEREEARYRIAILKEENNNTIEIIDKKSF